MVSSYALGLFVAKGKTPYSDNLPHPSSWWRTVNRIGRPNRPDRRSHLPRRYCRTVGQFYVFHHCMFNFRYQSVSILATYSENFIMINRSLAGEKTKSYGNARDGSPFFLRSVSPVSAFSLEAYIELLSSVKGRCQSRI